MGFQATHGVDCGVLCEKVVDISTINSGNCRWLPGGCGVLRNFDDVVCVPSDPLVHERGIGAIYHTIAVDLGILNAIRRDGDDPVRAAKGEGIEDAEV
jgi:hypothetical protein